MVNHTTSQPNALEAAEAELKAKAASEQVWGGMLLLPEYVDTVPTLPENMLPDPLRTWLVDVATRVCVPLEMLAAPALVGLGAVVGRTIGIRPNRFDDYITVPNLWGSVVAPPGFMKSALVKEAMRPLSLLAAEERTEYEKGVADSNAYRERISAEIAGVKTDMVRAARGKGGNLETLQGKLATLTISLSEETSTERRYYTQDASVEKLGELLRDNPRGLLLLRDELSGWLRTLDKPGREGDREFFLEAWNGTGDFTCDRIGRGTVYIPNMTLSVVGGTQPGKMKRLIEDAIGDDGAADGMLQRLQLIVWPDALGKWSDASRWPNRKERTNACEVYRLLASSNAAALGAEEVDGGISFLCFDEEAQKLWDEWRSQLENRLRGGSLAGTPAFASHLGKYRSLMPSLALLFHLVEVACGRATGPVGLGPAKRAAAWCDFLEAHARKVYAAELHPQAEPARALVAHIKAHHVKDGDNIRDIARHHWAALDTAERVDRAVVELEAVNWARIETQETGGRPAEVLRLHPGLRNGGGA